MSIDLPLRPTEVRVTVKKEPEIVLVMKPLSDEQALTLKDRAEFSIETNKETGEAEVNMSIPHGRMAHLFASQLIALEGELTVGGGLAFDPTNAAHVLAIPRGWKIDALSELVTEAFIIPKELKGNSKAPEQPSPKDSTPSQD